MCSPSAIVGFNFAIKSELTFDSIAITSTSTLLSDYVIENVQKHEKIDRKKQKNQNERQLLARGKYDEENRRGNKIRTSDLMNASNWRLSGKFQSENHKKWQENKSAPSAFNW